MIAAGGAVLMILPFYWMLVTALSPATDVMAFPPEVDAQPRDARARMVRSPEGAPWHLYYWNSLVVAVISVGCSLLFGLFAGYAFAVYRFLLQNVLFLLILSTLMVPVQVTSVALYILLSRIGWVDTYAGILAPNFASAFGVFLLRQAIRQVPHELDRGSPDRRSGRDPHRPDAHLAARAHHARDRRHDPLPRIPERLPVAGHRHQFRGPADAPRGHGRSSRIRTGTSTTGR